MRAALLGGCAALALITFRDRAFLGGTRHSQGLQHLPGHLSGAAVATHRAPVPPKAARPAAPHAAETERSGLSFAGAGVGMLVAFAAVSRGLRVAMGSGGQSGRFIFLSRPHLKGIRRRSRLRKKRTPDTYATKRAPKRYMMYEILERMPAEWEIIEEPEEPLDPVENVPLAERYPYAGPFVHKMHPQRIAQEEEEPLRPFFGNYLGGYAVPKGRVENRIDRKGYPRHGKNQLGMYALPEGSAAPGAGGLSASLHEPACCGLAGPGAAVGPGAVAPVGRALFARNLLPAALFGAGVATGGPGAALAEETASGDSAAPATSYAPARIAGDPYDLIKGGDGKVGKNEFEIRRNYQEDTVQVIKHMRISGSLEKGAPNMEAFNKQVKEEINDWVAMYRRQDNIASKQSYSNLSTAMNTLASHLVTYGNKFPFPQKRRERLFELLYRSEKFVKKGK